MTSCNHTQHPNFYPVMCHQKNRFQNKILMSGFSAPVTNVTQAEVDKLLVNFVCEDNQPFYVMELPLFKKNIYIETQQPQCIVMTRKTLLHKIQEAFENMKSALVKKLNDVDYVFTTAECWSARQCSYLEVTCLWIAKTSLERSCERRLHP